MSPFEKFTATKGNRGTPSVTLVAGEVKVHSARFNAAACRRFELAAWKNVEFHFDRERRIVGFGRMLERTPSSRRLCMSAHGMMAVVGCLSFLRHIGITETIRLPIELDEETGYLVAMLPKNEEEKP